MYNVEYSIYNIKINFTISGKVFYSQLNNTVKFYLI